MRTIIKTMKKYMFILFVLIFVSCSQTKNKTELKENSPAEPTYEQKLLKAFEGVEHTEYKGMEMYKGANSLFYEYKQAKKDLILKALKNEDTHEEMRRLNSIATEFNKITADSNYPYLEDFDNLLLWSIAEIDMAKNIE